MNILITVARRITYLNEKHLAYVTIKIHVYKDEADEEDKENQLKVEDFIFVFNQYLVNLRYYCDITTTEYKEYSKRNLR